MSITTADLAEAAIDASLAIDSDNVTSEYLAWSQQRADLYSAAFGVRAELYDWRPEGVGLGSTWDDVVRCYAEVRSPFDGLLEAPSSVLGLLQRHGDALDLALDQLRRRLAEVAAGILELELGLPADAVVSDERLARHGELGERPDRYPVEEDW